MIYLMVYADTKQTEVLQLEVKKTASILTDDYWNMAFFNRASQLNQCLETKPIVDLLCCDITEENVLEWLESFRREYKLTKVMLIVDSHISPTRYLRPQIMASSLLLKPYSAARLQEVLHEFFLAFLEEQPDDNVCFVFKSKEGKRVIPYSQIYYLEAREKKLFVHTLQEEYAFYETLDNVLLEIPDYFVRTHRSFVVNSHMIEKIRLSENCVTLHQGFEVPLSRSYKSALKGFGR